MPTITLTTPDLWLNGPSTVRSVWSPTVSGLPTGAIINSVTLSFYNGHTYASPGYSEVFWGTEPLVAQRLWYYHRGTPNKTITIDLTGKVTGNGTFSLLFYKTKNDEGSNSNVCFQNVSVVIDYTNPRSTFTLDKTALDAGTALGVNISRIDASYTHKVTFAFGSRSYTATGVGTSTSYTIPVAWLDQIPNAVSGTGNVTVETLNSAGTSMGSVSASFTLTAGSGVVPTVGTITATLLDGLDGLYIQGHSKCRVAVSGYTAGTGATVASVLISGNGDSAWAESMVSSLLRTPGTVTFTVTIKDSRAREASGSISITVEAYTDIAITGRTALRCLSDGTVSRTKGKSAKLGCSYAMTTVGSNAATVRVYWRVYGTEAWTEITGWNSASGYTAVALTDAVALDGRYEFLFRVADRMSMAEQTAVIAPGSVFMVWSKIRNAFGFGAYPTGEKQVAIAEDWRLVLGSTDVGNAIRQLEEAIDTMTMYPVGSIYISVNWASPASLFGGTWEILNDVFLLAAGSYANAGTFGGEAVHTLNTNEIPSHTHNINAGYANIGSASSVNGKLLAGDDNNGWLWDFASTGSNGGGAAHNNMPPYLAVYMWKRVA